MLRDFLAAEPEWRIADELGGRTTIVRRVGEVAPNRVWNEQPYVLKKARLGAPTMYRQRASMIRHGHADELTAGVREVANRRFGR